MSSSNHSRPFPTASFHPESDPATHPPTSESSDPNAIPWFFEFVSCSICNHDLIDTLQSDTPDRFWMAECGHFLCDNHDHRPKVCTCCGQTPVQTYRLSSNLEASLQPWFKKPTGALQNAIRTVGFQTTEMARVIRELRKLVKIQNEALDNANRAAQRDQGLREALRSAKAEISRLRGLSEGSRHLEDSRSYSESSMHHATVDHQAHTRTSSQEIQPPHQIPQRPINYGSEDRQRRTFPQGNGDSSQKNLDGFGQPMPILGNNVVRKRFREDSPPGDSGPHSDGRLHTPFITHTPNPRGPTAPQRYSLHTRPIDYAKTYDDTKVLPRVDSRQAMRERLTGCQYDTATIHNSKNASKKAIIDARLMPPPALVPQMEIARNPGDVRGRARSVVQTGSDPITCAQRPSFTPIQKPTQNITNSLQAARYGTLASNPTATPRFNKINREPFVPGRQQF